MKDFIKEQKWVFAKNYVKTYPHEYIVRNEDNQKGFDSLVKIIKKQGYKKPFLGTIYTYFEIDGYKYWNINNILNREKVV